MTVVALSDPTDKILSTGFFDWACDCSYVHVDVGAIMSIAVIHVGSSEEWS